VHDATIDPQTIQEQWKKYPTANIGIATGEKSGLLVIDVDPRNDGNENLFLLERTHGELPKTLTSISGGGGSHLFFKYTPGVKNQSGRIASGIDAKSNGGYIIASPSLHASGRPYRWVPEHGPDELPLAECPDWFLRLLRENDTNHSSNDAGSATVCRGGRNVFLASLAGSMRRRGLGFAEIEACLQHVNNLRCEPPLSSTEVSSIAKSISRYDAPSTVNREPLTTRGRASERETIGGYEPSQWPDALAQDAFYGLAGQFVRLVEPHSEADPAALLIQFLVAFGNVIGRNAHFMVGADKHYANLFTVLVGTTSKGRKGTSEGVVRWLLQTADKQWVQDQIMSGLSSGEGLIWQVRDPIEAEEPTKKKGKVIGADKGVDDKRLLIVEPEFARVLQVCDRETNTLSAILRQGWDTGDLRILTKKNTAKVSGAHISLIGHITRDELRRLLTDTAAVNGFANRFLWVCVRRSKLLPDGGELSTVDFSIFRRDLAEAVSFARKSDELKRTTESREIWHTVYAKLSEGQPGLLGAATSRAEAQVMRIALIYTLLDCSPVIRQEHLRAGLAVWDYCENSARFLFGSALGDPTADEILRALRDRTEGMTRQDIRDVFSRHKSSAEIGRALASLAENGLARFQREDSGGRPTERWFTLDVVQKATNARNLSDTAQIAPRAHIAESRPFSRGF
jgi:hypothetical protein